METIAIASVVGIVLFAIGVFCGKSSPCVHEINPCPVPPYRCGCGCGGNWCYKTHCTPDCWKYNCYDITAGKTLAEAEAESRGFKDGYKQGYKIGQNETIYNTSRSRQEEFLVKFADAVKPLDELRKEYKIKN